MKSCQAFRNILSCYIWVVFVFYTWCYALDDCYPNPCLNDGSCFDGVDSFLCECKDGFSGDNCEINYNDCDPNPCLNGGTCTDGSNSFTCECDKGFSGDTCGIVDANCDPNPCQNQGTCINSINSFTCECLNGFIGLLCEEGEHIIIYNISCTHTIMNAWI